MLDLNSFVLLVEGITKIGPVLGYRLVSPYFGNALDLVLYPTLFLKSNVISLIGKVFFLPVVGLFPCPGTGRTKSGTRRWKPVVPKINPRKGMQLDRIPKPIKFVNKRKVCLFLSLELFSGPLLFNPVPWLYFMKKTKKRKI
jgi:hypothetical protein